MIDPDLDGRILAAIRAYVARYVRSSLRRDHAAARRAMAGLECGDEIGVEAPRDPDSRD
jgi:hypothetical protein